MTTRQSEWDSEDRVIILAYMEYKSDLCPGCGLPLSEAAHIAGRDEKRYDANFLICDGCTAREEKQHQFHQEDEKRDSFDPKVGARHWIVNRYGG